MKHGFRPRLAPATFADFFGGWEEGENPYDVYDEDDCCDDDNACERCGGEGFIEYAEAGPDVWGEDCPSELNHLVTCPDCRGYGFYK